MVNGFWNQTTTTVISKMQRILKKLNRSSAEKTWNYAAKFLNLLKNILQMMKLA
jgi:hypothetical protein